MGDQQIIETIDDLEQIDVLGAEVLNAWKKGDEDRLADLNLKELKNSPRLYQVLFLDRNKKWLRDIEGYLTRPENTMVIVGMAHLAGEGSLTDLLHKRGYRVVKLQN